MIIEFTGLPGCGKSTFSNNVYDFLQSKKYPVWTPSEYWKKMGLQRKVSRSKRVLAVIEKSAELVKAAVKNIELICAISWGEVLRNNSPSNIPLIINSFLSNLAEMGLAKKVSSRGTTALLDEGVVHRAYSLLNFPNKAVNLKSIERYARTVELPDVLVYIRLNKKICLERILKRGVPLRMAKLHKSEMIEMLANGELLLDTLIEAITGCRVSGCSVLEIDTETFPSEKHAILKFLFEHLQDSQRCSSCIA